ncbi:unnamed protein product [Mortierella alpina]
MHHQQFSHQQAPLPQPHHPHPYQQPMHPDMDMHHQYSQHHLPHSQPYGPAPTARGPAHVRTHSRSSSGSYPQHVPYPVPHHEIAPPGFQGPVPGAPPPPMVVQPDSIIADSRHVRYSSSQPVSGGYHVPPPHAMGSSSDPSAWQAPAPYGVAEQHLHQRPAHHPHPYHAPHPSSSHTRSHSRSHSRTHSHSQPQQQQQYAPHQAIQSPRPQDTPLPRALSIVMSKTRTLNVRSPFASLPQCHINPISHPWPMMRTIVRVILAGRLVTSKGLSRTSKRMPASVPTVARFTSTPPR